MRDGYNFDSLLVRKEKKKTDSGVSFFSELIARSVLLTLVIISFYILQS